MSSPIYFVFDVESIGLHGEGFAVGFVVVNKLGEEMAAATISCNRLVAEGNPSNREWVSKNVPENLSGILKETPQKVRDAFWKQWLHFKEMGAIMVADCAWPVEARFLASCVSDSPDEREWQGPYPLHDLGSILFSKSIDPLTKFPRKENELPEHNPECDARQSARILVETLYPKTQ